MCKECRQRPPNQLKINDRNIEALSKPNVDIPSGSATGTSNATSVQGQGSSNIPQPRRAATNQPQTTTAGMTGTPMTHKQNQPQSQRNSRLENRPSLCRQQSECSEGTKKDENTKFRINQRTRIMLKNVFRTRFLENSFFGVKSYVVYMECTLLVGKRTVFDKNELFWTKM